MLEFIQQPWPWYVSGPLLGGILFLLLKTGKTFGVSSTLRTACAIGGGGKVSDFFNFHWKDQIWNVVFVFGAAVGGFITVQFLSNGAPVEISEQTITDLEAIGIQYDTFMAPQQLFSWESFSTPVGWIVMVGGGFLVGFGARWAGGCTSGHAITGLSNLQLPSLIAVVGFFIGGLIMVHLIFPILF